jgi:hypothetical protein
MLKRYNKYGGSPITHAMQKKTDSHGYIKTNEQCLENLISMSRRIKGDFDLKIKMCHEMPIDEIG